MVRCRAEWREALKLVSGVGCNLPWQLHHKVFFYLSCGAMLPTVWHFISFQFLWSNKQISLFTFQVPTLPWSINPTHCVGAYSSLIINSIHVFIREACRLQNQILVKVGKVFIKMYQTLQKGSGVKLITIRDWPNIIGISRYFQVFSQNFGAKQISGMFSITDLCISRKSIFPTQGCPHCCCVAQFSQLCSLGRLPRYIL